MISVSLHGRRGDFALDVEFSVPASGTTALLGPSGSGKTSVLRALAGLDRHPGIIRFGNEVWQSETHFVPAHRRQVGWVPQGGGLLPHLSVGENLDYAARRSPIGPFEREDVIRRTRTGALLLRSPQSLSGGEAQRASIARGLLGQPRLLLMDEPLSGLDIQARHQFIDELRDLFSMLSVPAIYVTHDSAEATALASRTLEPFFNR